MGRVRFSRLAALVFALASLGGCARSASVNYYILRSMRGPEPGVRTAAPGPAKAVVIGPVSIPAYLDRPQMVTRPSPETIKYAEFDRWAEPLDKNLARVIADDISALLPGANVCVFPCPTAFPVTYQVTLDVIELEKVASGKVILEASWKIFGNKGKELLVMRRSRVSEPVEANAGYSAIASAESLAVKALSRRIATVVEAMPAVLAPKSGHAHRRPGAIR